MQQGLQDCCPSYETIRRWVKSFREGREDTADDHRSGRPITATSASVVEKVSNAIDKDRRLTTREVAEVVGISHDSAHKILTVDLGKKKLCARWIPHLLTDEQKGIRITISSNHLRRYKRQGNAFLNRIVACDETWAHSWEPELKRQSSSWCGPDSPRPQKATRSFGTLKVMHITFFDFQGIIFDQAVPHGQTVNGDYYLSVLHKVRRAIRDKRPELKEVGSILLQNNASPHRKKMVLETLETWDWEILPHPPYLPDLSPCDFFLFPRIKENIRGRRYSIEDEVNEAYKHGLSVVTKAGVQDGIYGLVHQWQKCIELEGSYTEN